MTDEPVPSNPTDDLDAQPSATPPTADECTFEADPPTAAPPSEAPATLPRRADRTQQIVTAAVLLLITASAVILTVAIANQ
jgi:hypothetical protein